MLAKMVLVVTLVLELILVMTVAPIGNAGMNANQSNTMEIATLADIVILLM